jgi:hypothetical protein
MGGLGDGFKRYVLSCYCIVPSPHLTSQTSERRCPSLARKESFHPSTTFKVNKQHKYQRYEDNFKLGLVASVVQDSQIRRPGGFSAGPGLAGVTRVTHFGPSIAISARAALIPQSNIPDRTLRIDARGKT